MDSDSGWSPTGSSGLDKCRLIRGAAITNVTVDNDDEWQ